MLWGAAARPKRLAARRDGHGHRACAFARPFASPLPLPPFERGRWSSPLRGPWMASFLSIGLAVLFGLELITGYLSHAAYEAARPHNAVFAPGPDQALYLWGWPTSPPWLYAATQGLHVLAGLAAIPILAAKLWTVMPKFYKWPPVRSPAEALERLTLGLLVASAIFLLVTGVLNIGYWYPFGFSFVPAHYYAAWMFGGALAGHVLIKLPVMARAFRERGVLRPLRDDLAATLPEPADPDTSAPTGPGPATITRRAWLGLVGAGSVGLVVLSGGASWGGLWRSLSPLSPRSQTPPGGPGDFPVNKTASAAGITPDMTGASWRLVARGPGHEPRAAPRGAAGAWN